MPLYIPKGTVREVIPQGLYLSVCCAVFDVGTQDLVFEGHHKDVHQVIIVWELPECRMTIEAEGKKIEIPRVISRTFTLTWDNRGHLRKLLESWRGQAFTKEQIEANFDLGNLVGVAGQLQVLHNEKDGNTYANVDVVLPMPKGIARPEGERKTRFFSLEEDIDIDTLRDVPNWIVEKIKASKEYRERYEGPVAPGEVAPSPEESYVPPEEDPEVDLPF